LENAEYRVAESNFGNLRFKYRKMIRARRFIRKMRGGAQAHLIEGHDGNCYVVKFMNNPQHRRVLINEWMAAQLMQYLGIKTPQTALVHVSAEFLSDNPEVYLQGKTRIAVNTGIHFGSRHPGHPNTTKVYDLLPDTFLARITNRADFIAALAFDHWVCNGDQPQVIFSPQATVGHETGNPRFDAWMIDRGFAFGGVDWLLRESPLTGVHHRRVFYDGLRGISDCEPWLSYIEAVPERFLYNIVDTIPPCWRDTTNLGIERLIRELLNGRSRVADSIIASANGAHRPFRNWINGTDRKPPASAGAGATALIRASGLAEDAMLVRPLTQKIGAYS
jgi:hypothetical protein